MSKIIAFSLWGEDPKYCVGALRNAELAAEIYPGWKCRFYFGTVGEFNQSSKVGGLLGRTIYKLMEMDHVEVEFLNEPANWTGMFWRFYPAAEDDVDVFLSRDCDSRLNEREAAAVNEWLEGPKLVHSMGDHPHHFNPSQALMGGMFGMKRYACPMMKTLINNFRSNYPDAWQCDQDFLKDHVWPLVFDKVLAHSDLHHGCQSFPAKRNGLEFVGKIFLADETT